MGSPHVPFVISSPRNLLWCGLDSSHSKNFALFAINSVHSPSTPPPTDYTGYIIFPLCIYSHTCDQSPQSPSIDHDTALFEESALVLVCSVIVAQQVASRPQKIITITTSHFYYTCKRAHHAITMYYGDTLRPRGPSRPQGPRTPRQSSQSRNDRRHKTRSKSPSGADPSASSASKPLISRGPSVRSTTSAQSAQSMANSALNSETRHKVMVNYLYQQQCTRLWVAEGHTQVEGCLVRRSRGEYVACPTPLITSPFAIAMEELDVKVSLPPSTSYHHRLVYL